MVLTGTERGAIVSASGHGSVGIIIDIAADLSTADIGVDIQVLSRDRIVFADIVRELAANITVVTVPAPNPDPAGFVL